AGLLPKAPGTWGTVVGVPIVALTLDLPFAARLAILLALIVAGTWSATVLDQTMGTGDNQCIVIDEVIGFYITGWTLTQLSSTNWIPWVAAFALFRLFDVVKLPRVRQLDRWSKTKSGWWGGFGVMADDILAGIQGLLVMVILQFMHRI